MANTGFAVGAALSVVAGLAAGGLTAHTLRVRRATEAPPSVSREAAMAAFEGERNEALALHMALVAEGDAPLAKYGAVGGSWSKRVTVRAGECVAVIATAFNHHRPVAVAWQGLSDDNQHIATGVSPPLSVTRTDGLVAQAQWCDAEDHTRVAVFESRALTEQVFDRPLVGTAHFAIYRGTWARVGGFTRLTRGAFASQGLRFFPPQAAVDESNAFVPPGVTMVGVPVPMRVDGARLIPSDEATYRVLYERVRGPGDRVVNPRIDGVRPQGEPWGTGLPENLMGLYESMRGERPGPPLHDPVFEAGGVRRRVLAVIDTGRLRAPCVTLMFTRLLFLHGAALWRHDGAPGDAGVPLDARENTVLDRRCPAHGTSVYAVDERDQEEWLLRVFADPLPAPVAPAVDATGPAADEPASHGRRRHGRRHRR